MKRVAVVLCILLLSCIGCSKSSTLSPAEFTAKYASSVQTAVATAKVQIVKDLQVQVVASDGREFTAFLQNAYDEYNATPNDEQEIIHRYTKSFLETTSKPVETIDRTKIVPVIKDRPWLEAIKATFSKSGGNAPENVIDEVNADLVIVYAEDTPASMRYLVPEDLTAAKVERAELRSLAAKNLKNILPPMQRHGDSGFFMVTAGGDYEASLLAIDSLWTKEKMPVDGDIVVAIPARDVLLVTGSANSDGIARMRKSADELFESGTRRLTKKLFVFRDGVWKTFDGN